jgi:predicted tellurium resistance membrane protein TerC
MTAVLLYTLPTWVFLATGVALIWIAVICFALAAAELEHDSEDQSEWTR